MTKWEMMDILGEWIPLDLDPTAEDWKSMVQINYPKKMCDGERFEYSYWLVSFNCGQQMVVREHLTKEQ